MGGSRMLKFIPLHLGVLDRSTAFENLVLNHLGTGFKTLVTEEWFEEGHGYGNFVWTPPPAACEVVVEQLGKARLKRPELMHLVFVPCLMTGMWRRWLTRRTDLYLRVDWEEVWPLDTNYEPLFLFVALPYRSYEPQLSERQVLLDDLFRILSRKGVPKITSGKEWAILCKFLLSARELCPLPWDLVSNVL